MSGVVTVRIFLASPQSDTVLAREAVVKAVRAIGADPVYRRRFQLDLLRWDGEWVVSELELIEPGLYLDVSPANAEPFADLIAARAAGRS